jgi:ABC-type multidrug transport system fused ATPase/permease subunit
MKTTKKIFVFWIILMFLATFTCLLTYLVAQQTVRHGANELPAQFATETAIKLENGKSAESAIPANKIDISKSLDTFVMVYDHNKNLLATSGMMGNNKPSYPRGVLDYVDQKGKDRVTWQPKTGLRFATVAIKFDNGYIVAGRSLQETEKLIGRIGELVLMAWVAFFVCSIIAFVIVYSVVRKIHEYKQKN